MWIQLTVASLSALAISLVLNRLMLRLAPALGLMDQPGERRIHATPIPRAGGIAIWLSFLSVVAVGLASGLLGENGSLSWKWLGAFTAGSTVLMIAGIVDDRIGLRALVKLSAHILAPAVFFLLHPFKTGLFPADWPMGFEMAVFVIWSVVLINAFNLIDGLDGLCGGLAGVATLGLAAIALANGRTDAALLLLVMGGAIIGFLRFNINPARIFLGDAGSMLMGFIIAAAATDAAGRKAVVGMILLPIAVAGVPLLDVLLALWRRSALRLTHRLRGEKGAKGLFDADSNHLHHRLLASSGSQHRVAIILHAIAIGLSVLAFLPMLLGDKVLGLSLVGIFIVAMVGVRNLARVEMEHMGNVVHMVIKIPKHRRRLAVGLFIYDLLVLASSAGAAIVIETNRFVRGAPTEDLLVFVVLFTTLGSIATLMAGVHARLWVRATLRDLVALQCWLLLAAMASFTLFSLANSALEWSALRLMLISFVLAACGLSLPRVALDLFRELGLEARHRRPPHDNHDKGHGPVVVLGAGDMGTLLLDHLKSSAHDQYPGMRILGFLDDTKVLHGRRLRTFRILGGLSMVPELVEKQGLRGIVLAINRPRHDLLAHLEELSRTYGLRIYRWKVSINPLAEEPAVIAHDHSTVAPEKPIRDD